MTHLGNRPKLSLKLGQIMLAMFFFLLFSISRFYNITKAPVWEDNMSWLYRIGHYTWILERNFKGNPEPGKDLAFAGKASYHPGVTVMTFSGISYRLVKKLAAANFPDYVPCGFSDYSCKYLWLELLATKIPIVLISGIGLGLTLFYVCRLCGWESAVLGGFLILVDPLLYLSSRDLHLDFLQGVFILMSLILFIYGVFKKKSNYFFFSGVLYGLAMLTRFASVLYLPGYLAVLFLAVIPRGTEEKKTVVAPGLFSFVKVPWCYALKFGLTFLLSAVVTFFVLFPPMWVAPYPTLKYIVEGSLASTSDHAGEVGGSLSYFPGLGLYIKLLVNEASAVGLFVIVIGLVVLLFPGVRKELSPSAEFSKFSRFGYVFYVLYFLLMNISEKRFSRYLVPLLLGLYFFGSMVITPHIKSFLSYLAKLFIGRNSAKH